MAQRSEGRPNEIGGANVQLVLGRFFVKQAAREYLVSYFSSKSTGDFGHGRDIRLGQSGP